MPDFINGLFESLAGLVMLIQIRQIYKDKEVKGFHWFPIVFFTSWGYWNLYYYPHLNQWFSFLGGLLVVTANTIYTCQTLYYLRRKSC